jgi:hypothetical protein
VTVNDASVAFTRTGDLVTVSRQERFAPAPVLGEEFDDAGLDRTVHDFSESFGGWRPVQGTWVVTGGQLAQTSTADMVSFAALYDVPDDVVMSADIVPGPRGQTTSRTGLAFRYHDSRNYYRAEVLNSTSGATLKLVKIYDAQTTVLAETELPISANVPHKLVVSAIGKHLSAKVGDTSITAEDTQLPTGGAAAYTHRRAASFDDIVIREGIDQANWRGITGSVSVASGALRLHAARRGWPGARPGRLDPAETLLRHVRLRRGDHAHARGIGRQRGNLAARQHGRVRVPDPCR